MADKNFDKETSPSTTGLSDEMRNRILEEHARKYPGGDPAVRRTNPDKGTIGTGKSGKGGPSK